MYISKKNTYKRKSLIVLAVVAVAAFASVSHSASYPLQYEYRYWDWGQTNSREDYQFALLEAALEKTVPVFGDYRLTRVVKRYTARRGNIEVNLGKTINIRVSPWLMNSESSAASLEANIPVCFPIMANMMGHRRLVVKKGDVGKFNAVKTEQELKTLVLGQGQNWLDLKIYGHNGYPFDDNAPMMESLIPMLLKGRFDYIPLGILEIDGVIAGAGERREQVVEAPGIAIQYPLPMVYFVGKNRQDLADRVQLGLLMMREDGSLLALMKRYFGSEMNKVDNIDRVFYLDNPFAVDIDSCQKKDMASY